MKTVFSYRTITVCILTIAAPFKRGAERIFKMHPLLKSVIVTLLLTLTAIPAIAQDVDSARRGDINRWHATGEVTDLTYSETDGVINEVGFLFVVGDNEPILCVLRDKSGEMTSALARLWARKSRLHIDVVGTLTFNKVWHRIEVLRWKRLKPENN